MNRDDNDIKFKLSVRSYNELLMMLARFFMIDEMKRVFTKMLNDMILANIYTLNTMVNTYSKMGNIVEANLYVSKIF
jgi:pentatricopeptide repeat protein